MIRRTVTAKRQRERGQGLVEFALVLPLLLLLMVGVIEFGRLLFMYTEVSNAAREAVRYGIARGTDVTGDPRYLDCAGIIHAGQVSTALTSLTSEDFTIGYDRGGGSTYAVCGEATTTVDFGDRLVVTVSHSIQPMILFQDAGPFTVQFTAARTIIQKGIPMAQPEDKHDDDVDGLPDPPPGVTDLALTYVDPYSCQIQLTWSVVEGATEYEIYQENVGEIALVSGPPYPSSGSLSAVNGDIFQVRAAHPDGESPMSNKVTVSGCGVIPSPENVQFIVDDPAVCQGYLDWDPVVGVTVDGYHVYDGGGSLLGTVTDTRYPAVGSLSSANGQELKVRAFLGSEEGDAVSVYVAGCVPAAPTGLTFVLDQVSPPCQGHYYWNPVTDAEGYNLYQNSSLIATVTGTRYPADSGSVSVATGDQYTVAAYSAAGEGALSPAVTVTGCPVPGEPVSVVYYLHSNPTPPVWHANAPPPLTMNETAPAHPVLYNYNSTDDTKPGREVALGGGTPPVETDPAEYLEWRSEPLNQPLAIQGSATLQLWGKSPHEELSTTTAYLYDYDGSTYSYLGGGSYQFSSGVYSWSPLSISLGGGSVPAGHQLVVWLVGDDIKSLHFAYDTTVYPSRIEFTGIWGSY